jgi:hypothetical protein
MLSLVPKRKSYGEKMAEYISSNEYAGLSEVEQEAVCKKYLMSVIVKLKRQLIENNDMIRGYSGEKHMLLKKLKYVEENGLDGAEDTIDALVATNNLIADCKDTRNSLGWTIIGIIPTCEALLSVDDIRSLFNVSYQDMQEIRRECEGTLMEFLFMSWWAGDTVKLFGRAMFHAIRSDSKVKKQLDDGLEDFMLSSGVPIHKVNVTYDRYGDIASVEQAGPLLKRVK